MKKFKKIIAMCCAAVMAMSISSIGAFAKENDDVNIGDKVDYTVSIRELINGEYIIRNATQEEKVELMTKDNRVPGSEITIGTTKYIVADDYNLIFNGTDSNAEAESIKENSARGTGIPTSKGSLPYNGSYNFSSYIYTNKYFVAGSSGMLSPSIGIDLSAKNSQKIVADWIDGRNNESMGASSTVSLSAGGAWTVYNWVYAGEKFYIKFINKGTTNPSGSFSMYIDQ